MTTRIIRIVRNPSGEMGAAATYKKLNFVGVATWNYSKPPTDAGTMNLLTGKGWGVTSFKLTKTGNVPFSPIPIDVYKFTFTINALAGDDPQRIINGVKAVLAAATFSNIQITPASQIGSSAGNVIGLDPKTNTLIYSNTPKTGYNADELITPANYQKKNGFVYTATATYTGWFGANQELEKVINGTRGWTEFFSSVQGNSQVNGNQVSVKITGYAIGTLKESDVQIRIDRMMSNYFSSVNSRVVFATSAGDLNVKAQGNLMPISNNNLNGNLLPIGDYIPKGSFFDNVGLGLGVSTPIALLIAAGFALVILKR
jgi:hypothetical protein